MKYTFFIVSLLLVSCFGKTPEKTGMEGKILPEFSLLMPDSTTWINTKRHQDWKAIRIFPLQPLLSLLQFAIVKNNRRYGIIKRFIDLYDHTLFCNGNETILRCTKTQPIPQY